MNSGLPKVLLALPYGRRDGRLRHLRMRHFDRVPAVVLQVYSGAQIEEDMRGVLESGSETHAPKTHMRPAAPPIQINQSVQLV